MPQIFIAMKYKLIASSDFEAVDFNSNHTDAAAPTTKKQYPISWMSTPLDATSNAPITLPVIASTSMILFILLFAFPCYKQDTAKIPAC
jgi:hypothetical protein